MSRDLQWIHTFAIQNSSKLIFKPVCFTEAISNMLLQHVWQTGNSALVKEVHVS